MRLKLALVGLLAVALVAAGLTLSYRRGTPAEQAARRNEGRQAGWPLFDQLGLPEGASIYSPRVETVLGRRQTDGYAFEQEFTASGLFPGTSAFYVKRLQPAGWKVFDPRVARDDRVELCKAPWFLTIEERAAFPDQQPPSHRFALRLEWREGFRPERCPYPGS